MDKPVAYVLVGLPGSGKTTWANAHPEALPIASTDRFIEEWAAEGRLDYADSYARNMERARLAMRAQLAGLIAAGRPFIWDQTNHTRRKRERIYAKLQPTHRVVYVCFCVPVDECLARVRARERVGVIDERRMRSLAAAASFPEGSEPRDGVIPVIDPALKDALVRGRAARW